MIAAPQSLPCMREAAWEGGVRAAQQISTLPFTRVGSSKCSFFSKTFIARRLILRSQAAAANTYLMVRGSTRTYRLRADLLEDYLRSQFPGHTAFNVQVGAVPCLSNTVNVEVRC